MSLLEATRTTRPSTHYTSRRLKTTAAAMKAAPTSGGKDEGSGPGRVA
jgi:hypothetical protein